MKDEVSGKQYYAYPYTVTVNTAREARKLCAQLGGFLPEPRPQAENDFLRQFIDNPGTGFFFGMSDEETEGSWLWDTDFSPVTWFEWGRGPSPETWSEPNGGRRENCAALKSTGFRKPAWSDVPCNNYYRRNVVCEGQ